MSMTQAERIALLKAERDAIIQQRIATEDLVEKQQLQADILRKHLELKQAQGPLDAKAAAALKLRIKRSEEMAAALEAEADAGKAVAEGLGALGGLLKDFESSMLGSLATTLSSAAAQQKFRDQLSKTFSVQNIGYSILLKFTQATMELAYAQDAALVSFNKQTGAARLYEQQIMALERTTFQHGVGIGESAEAYAALATNVTDLRNMSRGTQDELSKTTAILGHMGVSMDTTAANVQFMTRSMGVSTAEASKYQRELFTLAQEIGMPPEQMAAGFKAAAPKLAAFGKQAGKVFTKLAKNARAAGMEVEQLLGIVEQFDTFEGAAESVGKLNALLGGPFLNSMEMVMTTDPSERMRMLSGALNDAGKSFDQMTYYEKKSIAAAAGLSDVNELALVMAGSFDESAGGANRSQAEIEALARQSKEFNTMMEELTQTMMMFALEMRPVIEGIKWILQGMQNMMPLFKQLTPSIMGVGAAMLFMKSGIDVTAWSMKGLTAAFRASPLAVLAGIILLGQGLAMMFGNEVAGALMLFAGAIWAVAIAFGAAGVASAGIIPAIGLLVTGIVMLIQALFGTDVGHSNFLEGLWKIGWAFGDIGTAITGLMGSIGPAVAAMFKFLTPLGIVMSIWDSIMGSSSETEKSMGRITSAEQPSVKNTIQPVEIVGIDPLKVLASILAPASLYNAIGGPAKKGRDAFLGSTGGTGGGASGQPIKHEITLEFDPRKAAFKDFVIDIVNKELNANQG